MYPHKRKVNVCFVDISVCANLITVGLAPATSLQQIIKGTYLTGTMEKQEKYELNSYCTNSQVFDLNVRIIS